MVINNSDLVSSLLPVGTYSFSGAYYIAGRGPMLCTAKTRPLSRDKLLQFVCYYYHKQNSLMSILLSN
jgi:hypothetical protein